MQHRKEGNVQKSKQNKRVTKLFVGHFSSRLSTQRTRTHQNQNDRENIW